MSALESVLGVWGLCKVDFGNPTQAQAAPAVGLRACVWGVLGLASRARMCAAFFSKDEGRPFISYARAEKPNKPNTPYTEALNVLICKGFSCVGFVLGCLFLCWVGFSGVVGHE